jgi:hypothetical protein
MPLRNEPPRPPNDVGRQAILSASPTPDGRHVRQPASGRPVWWATRHGELMVASLVTVVVAAVGAPVASWWRTTGCAVCRTVASLVALVAGLVASLSGRSR